MMTLDPQLRQALPHMRVAGEANWYVLTAYILHANTRGRAWPSIDTLSRETGYARPAVVAARAWLVEQGALHKVNYALRVGDERGHPRAEVMQLTGVIHAGGRVFRTLAAADPLEDRSSAPLAGPGDWANRQAGLPIDGGTSAGVTVNRQAGLPEDSAAPAANRRDVLGGGAGRVAAAPGLSGTGGFRPIYRVWEQEARQALSPILADILGELVDRYGEPVVVEAVREAVRSAGPGNFPVKYVMRILERWAGEGDLTPEASGKQAKRAALRRRLRDAGKNKPQPPDFSAGRTRV